MIPKETQGVQLSIRGRQDRRCVLEASFAELPKQVAKVSFLYVLVYVRRKILVLQALHVSEELAMKSMSTDQARGDGKLTFFWRHSIIESLMVL